MSFKTEQSDKAEKLKLTCDSVTSLMQDLAEQVGSCSAITQGDATDGIQNTMGQVWVVCAHPQNCQSSPEMWGCPGCV